MSNACATDHQSSTDPVMSALISVHAAHGQHGPAEVKFKTSMCIYTYPIKEHTGSLNQNISIKAEFSFYLHKFAGEGKHNQFITCVKYSILIPPFYLFDANERSSHPSGFLLQT